jgi:DNA polymerase-4
MMRTIMHIDMNAFFASVEQQCNPWLRNKPIAVIGASRRTVVTSASYQARSFGVTAGMNLWEAKKRCPHLILVPGNNAKYTDTCVQLVSIFKRYTPLVELFSIDEAFLDITGSFTLFHTADHIAASIKKEITDTLGLTCSIGIAPNKLLAKLASGLKKPDGLVTIKHDDVSSVLEHLPVNKLCGIGPHVERALSERGITTCGQLGRTSPDVLEKRFGSRGKQLHAMGQGSDDSPVIPLDEAPPPQSIGHSMTLPADVAERKLMENYLFKLSEMVGRRLRKHALQGRTLTLTIRYSDFTTFTRQRTFKHSIDNTPPIYHNALTLLNAITFKQPVRLLGVSMSNLLPKTVQLTLFGKEYTSGTLTSLMDEVNDRYGESTLTWGTLLLAPPPSGVIPPAWRPPGNRNTTRTTSSPQRRHHGTPVHTPAR